MAYLNRKLSLTVVFCLLLFSTVYAQRKANHRLVEIDADTARTNTTRTNIRAIDNDVFNAGEFTGTDHSPIKYRLLQPEAKGSGKRYPLVIVLHGSGAIGTDNTAQLGVLVKYWAQPHIREQYPAFVLAPQFPQRSSRYALDKKENVISSHPDICLKTLLQLVDSLKSLPMVDSNRIYIIGFSIGGSTTVNAVGLRPGLFTAAVSISGIPDFLHLDELATTPLWLIHGNADNENTIVSDALLSRLLSKMAAKKTRFWEINKLKHDIYPDLYTTTILPQWLFGFKKK